MRAPAAVPVWRHLEAKGSQRITAKHRPRDGARAGDSNSSETKRPTGPCRAGGQALPQHGQERGAAVGSAPHPPPGAPHPPVPARRHDGASAGSGSGGGGGGCCARPACEEAAVRPRHLHGHVAVSLARLNPPRPAFPPLSLPFPARPGLAGQLQSSVAPGGGAPHGPAHPLCSSPRSRRRLAFLPTNLMGGRRPPRFARLKKAGVAAPPTNKGSPCRCAFPLAAGRSARRRWPHQDGGSGQRSGVCRGEADLQPGPGRGEAAREGAVPGLVPGGAQRG